MSASATTVAPAPDATPSLVQTVISGTTTVVYANATSTSISGTTSATNPTSTVRGIFPNTGNNTNTDNGDNSSGSSKSFNILFCFLAFIGLMSAIFYSIHAVRRRKRQGLINPNDDGESARPARTTWRPETDEVSPPRYNAYTLDQPYVDPEMTASLFPDEVAYGGQVVTPTLVAPAIMTANPAPGSGTGTDASSATSTPTEFDDRFPLSIATPRSWTAPATVAPAAAATGPGALQTPPDSPRSSVCLSESSVAVPIGAAVADSATSSIPMTELHQNHQHRRHSRDPTAIAPLESIDPAETVQQRSMSMDTTRPTTVTFAPVFETFYRAQHPSNDNETEQEQGPTNHGPGHDRPMSMPISISESLLNVGSQGTGTNSHRSSIISSSSNGSSSARNSGYFDDNNNNSNNRRESHHSGSSNHNPMHRPSSPPQAFLNRMRSEGPPPYLNMPREQAPQLPPNYDAIVEG